jgi:hypothetical protein
LARRSSWKSFSKSRDEFRGDTTMATTQVAIATMKVAQITKPGGDFQVIEREIPKPVQDRCASRCRRAASATATCSRRKASGPVSSIPVCRSRSGRHRR